MKLINEYVAHVKTAISNATEHRSKLMPGSDVLKIEGMSSQKVRHLLNNICSLHDSRYLEIGTWKGSTFIAALYNNTHVNATCIENFSDFGGPKSEFEKNIQKCSSMGQIPTFQFIEQNCFNVDLSSIQKKNIYFFDGGHEISDHTLAFTYFDKILDDVFICIVDDWNHKHNNVQIGTKKAFEMLEYNVIHESILPAKFNGDHDLWWNGIYVAVVQKTKT